LNAFKSVFTYGARLGGTRTSATVTEFSAPTGELAEFPVTLETTFGVAKQNPSLVPSTIRALPLIGDMPDPAQTPPEVGMLVEAIMRLTK
jgi:hypothetical protein